jgi:hypothetical protein
MKMRLWDLHGMAFRRACMGLTFRKLSDTHRAEHLGLPCAILFVVKCVIDSNTKSISWLP